MGKQKVEFVADVQVSAANIARLIQMAEEGEDWFDSAFATVADVTTETHEQMREARVPARIKAEELIQIITTELPQLAAGANTIRVYITRACRILVCGGTVASKDYADCDDLFKAANAELGVSRAKGGGRKRKTDDKSGTTTSTEPANVLDMLRDTLKKGNKAFVSQLRKVLNESGYELTARMAAAPATEETKGKTRRVA